MNALDGNDFFEQDQKSDYAVCPFIRTLTDESIRFGFCHRLNYCYKPKKAQPVRSTYQQSTCLTKNHVNCQIFQNEWNGRLPQDIRGKKFINRKIFILLWVVIIIFLIIGGIFVVLSIFGNSILALFGIDPIIFPTFK